MWRSLVLITFALGCGSGQKEAVETPVSSAEKIDSMAIKPMPLRSRDQNVLLKKEIDLNIDGKIDVWRYYDDKGEKIRDEMDMDFDGKVMPRPTMPMVKSSKIDLAFDRPPTKQNIIEKET